MSFRMSSLASSSTVAAASASADLALTSAPAALLMLFALLFTRQTQLSGLMALIAFAATGVMGESTYTKYCGDSYDIKYGAVATASDGGYFVVASYASGGYVLPYVSKVALNKTVEWVQLSPGATYNRNLYAVVAASDGGCVAVGCGQVDGSDSTTYSIQIKYSGSGALVWITANDANYNTTAITLMSNGTYIAVSSMTGPMPGPAIRVLISNETGEHYSAQISHSPSTGLNTFRLRDTVEFTSSTGRSVAMVGDYYDSSTSHYVPWVVVLKSTDMTTLQDQSLSCAGYDCFLNGVISPAVDTLIMVGQKGTDIHLLKMTVPAGTGTSWILGWDYTLSAGSANVAMAVTQIRTGEICIGGCAILSGQSVPSGWFLKIYEDSNGMVIRSNPAVANNTCFFKADKTAEGSTAVFAGNTLTSGGNHNVMLYYFGLNCAAGTHIVSATYICASCEVGTYQAQVDQTTCLVCGLGTYQNQTGQSSCISCGQGTFQNQTAATSCYSCPVGQFQNLTGQAACQACSAGTFQNSTGSASCVGCGPGYYQSQPGASACLPCGDGTYSSSNASQCSSCPVGYYPAVTKDKCLYKGMFDTVDNFTASQFAQACFNNVSSVLTLAKPFTTLCRSAYRSLCCNGSSTLSTLKCNYGLELMSAGDTLYDHYCSACPFMTHSACPADGLCWNESAWTSNANSFYPESYTLACLESISPYCGPRLTANSSDPECSLVAGDCMAKINGSSYDNTWDLFRVNFTHKLPSTLPSCASIFSGATIPAGSPACSRVSDLSLAVNVSALAGPILSFALASGVLKDACGVSIPSSQTYNVALPTVTLGGLTISNGSASDKCAGLPISTTLTKPYSWPILNQYWAVYYNDTSGVSADSLTRLSSSETVNNVTGITVADYDLYPGKVLSARTSVLTPYLTKIYSEILQVTVPPIASGKTYCGTCQFADRSICAQLNGICWSNYTNYSAAASVNTTDCLKAVAPVCYNIWLKNGLDDSQCADFVSYFNFTAMKIKPNATSAAYSADGKSILLTFDQPIYRDNYVSYYSVLQSDTLRWLPDGSGGRWTSSRTLLIDYSPEKGILTNLKLLPNATYYDYIYAQNPAENSTLTITLPSLSAKLSITGLTTVSACDTIGLYAVLASSTLYQLAYRWDVAFLPALSGTLAANASTYLSGYSEFRTNNSMISVPSKFLSSGATVSFTLTAKAASYDLNTISSSLSVSVVGDIPKIKFMTKASYVLELDGNRSNIVPLQVDNKRCSSSEAVPVDITFQIQSGDSASSVTQRSTAEISIESTINSAYASYKTLFAGNAQGFQYLRYYNLTATITDRETSASNSDSLLLYFAKPDVKSIISTSGSLVSSLSDAVLSGKNSVIPVASDDAVSYLWKCESAASIKSGGSCTCPTLASSSLSLSVLTIPQAKLTSLCNYTFSLTVAATHGAYKRTAYNLTEFIAYAGVVPPISPVVISGTSATVSDNYFTFATTGAAAITSGNITSYNWTLVELESAGATSSAKYSDKNAFIYNFFTNVLEVQVDSSLKSRRLLADAAIPDSLSPTYLTSTVVRVLGVNQASLLREYKYTFGLTLYYATSPTYMFVSSTTEPAPRSRLLAITPSSGGGLSTTFSIMFTLPSSTDVDQARYQIYRRDCPAGSDLVPITKLLSSANTYSTVLSPGNSTCNYQVEIMVRAFEYGGYADSSATVVVQSLDSSVSVTDLLSKQLDGLEYLTADQQFTLLTQLTNVPLSDTSSAAREVTARIFAKLADLTNSAAFLALLAPIERVYLLYSGAATIGVLTTRQSQSINSTVATSMESSVGSYLTMVKTQDGGTYIIPSCLAALSGIADIGTSLQAEQAFFAAMQTAMDDMADMLLDQMMPGAPPYIITSPAIDMTLVKSYRSAFDSPLNYTGAKGSNVNLPGGLGNQLLSSVENVPSPGSVITVGAALYSTSFNPYSNMKTHSVVNTSFLTNASTQGLQANTIAAMYADLARGKFTNLVDLRDQEVDLVQIKFKPYEFYPNSSQSRINASIQIGTLPSGEVANFTIPVSANMTEYLKKTTLLPVYYNPYTGNWTNENCSLVTPNATDTVLVVLCRQVGTFANTKASARLLASVSSTSDAFSLGVDIIKNVLNVVRAGNYEQLLDFSSAFSSSLSAAVAYPVAAGILALIIFTEVLMFRLDRKALYLAQLKTLSKLFSPRERVSEHGMFFKVFSFFHQMRRRGINNMTERTQSPSTAHPTKPEPPKPVNGFSLLDQNDIEELRDLHCMYKQCAQVYDDQEMVEVMSEEFSHSALLARLTQARLDDNIIAHATTFWLVVKNEHPITNAFFKAEFATPRSAKVLVCFCSLVGELFVNGYFYNVESAVNISEETAAFVGRTVVFSIASVLLMIPLKIVVLAFLTGAVPKETWTREEIETSEARRPIFRMIGYVLAYCWIAVCLYGIIVYIIDFNIEARKGWFIAFATSFFSETAIISQLKIVFKVLFGLLLMMMVRKELMLTAAGVLTGFIIDWLSNLC